MVRYICHDPSLNSQGDIMPRHPRVISRNSVGFNIPDIDEILIPIVVVFDPWVKLMGVTIDRMGLRIISAIT